MYFYINVLSFFTWKKKQNRWVISLWAENAFILLEQICWYTDLQRKQNRTKKKKGKSGKTLSRAAHDDSEESYTEAEIWRPHHDWPLPLHTCARLREDLQRCSTQREQQTTWTRGKYVFSSLSI